MMRLFIGKADHFKHLRLHIGTVDTDGAGGQFDAVHDQIVGTGAHLFLIGFQIAVVLRIPAGEGMMRGDVALLLLAVLKQREFRYPEQVVFVVVDQTVAARDFAAQRAQRLPYHVFLIRAEEDDVARLGVHRIAHGLHQFGGHVLVEAALYIAVRGEGHVGQTLRAVSLYEFAEGIDFLAGHSGESLRVDGAYAAAVFNGAVEHHESAVAHRIGNVHQLHFKAGVRLIGSVIFHGFVPGHARQGQLKLHALDFLENLRVYLFHHGVDILFIDEGHFDIALGEFRLTVGAVVLVAEAAGDLIILIEARQHQKLLVDLRALRQGVERAGVKAAGHQKIARAFGCGFGQNGGFHFVEALFVQRVADAGDHAAANAQLFIHGGSAQIQIAVLQAHQFVFIGLIIDIDGRSFGFVQKHGVAHHDFHLAGFQIAVDGGFIAQANLAGYGQHIFAAQRLRQCKQFGGTIRSIEYQLYQTFAVAQPYEYQTAQIARALYPAGKMHGFTGHFAGDQAAIMIALVRKHFSFLLLH